MAERNRQREEQAIRELDKLIAELEKARRKETMEMAITRLQVTVLAAYDMLEKRVEALEKRDKPCSP